MITLLLLDPSFSDPVSSHSLIPPAFGDLSRTHFLKLPLVWRSRSIIFLKPAPSFGDPVSPLILSTPPEAIPVDHISWPHPFISRSRFIIHHKPTQTRPLIRRSRMITFLQPAPSFCDPGSQAAPAPMPARPSPKMRSARATAPAPVREISLRCPHKTRAYRSHWLLQRRAALQVHM